MALVKLSDYSRKRLERAAKLTVPPPVIRTEVIESVKEVSVLPKLHINEDGELIANFHNGTKANLGKVEGEDGKIPDHQIKNGEVRFEKPDGTWGEWIRFPHKTVYQGGGGLSEQRIIQLIEEFGMDSGEQEWLTAKATVTALGDTTVLTPASGKRVVIHKVYALNDPAATDPALIMVKLLNDDGVTEWIRNYGILTRQKRTGAVDAPVVINLDVAGSVAVTIFYEETD
jgi:hypothetical protein